MVDNTLINHQLTYMRLLSTLMSIDQYLKDKNEKKPHMHATVKHDILAAHSDENTGSAYILTGTERHYFDGVGHWWVGVFLDEFK